MKGVLCLQDTSVKFFQILKEWRIIWLPIVTGFKGVLFFIFPCVIRHMSFISSLLILKKIAQTILRRKKLQLNEPEWKDIPFF